MRSTIMEVSIEKFNNNIKRIKEYVGNKEIMPVIKANAYGTYINKKIDIINNFAIVAVALVDEAIELRKYGYQKDIFVLNQPDINEISNIIKYNIIIGLSDINFLKKMNTINDKIRVHLEIETGMNRTGIKIDELNIFINLLKKNKYISIEGIYTHLSSADDDFIYTKRQLDIFKRTVLILQKEFTNIKYIHANASNGLINFNDNFTNLVRPGIIMYGLESFKGSNEKIRVEPICKLKTKITFLKSIDKGEAVSYSQKFIAKKKMVIATIPIGYADGLKRCLSNKGYVVVNNRKARIIGNICMDSCMIDVTNIKDISVGMDVFIWDNLIQTVDDIAKKCKTINYELISTISNRVPRIFI